MISIIIPTYNRPKKLLACLQALSESKDAPEFEVIVVYRELNSLALRQDLYVYPFVKIIDYNAPGNGPAKNHGVMFAKGDFIAFIDDDCIVDEHWLFYLDKVQRATNADLVVGQCLPYDMKNPYIVAHQGLIMYYLDKNPIYSSSVAAQTPEDSIRYAEVEVGTTMNMLIRTNTFVSLGGFSSEFANHFGDDFEFNIRWKLNDTIIKIYSRRAMIYHNHSLTFSKLLKLSFRYGIGLNVCQRSLLEDIKIHPAFKEYSYIKDYISWQSPLLDTCTVFIRTFASYLALLVLLVKRLGSWYGKHNPEVNSKIYDDV